MSEQETSLGSVPVGHTIEYGLNADLLRLRGVVGYNVDGFVEVIIVWKGRLRKREIPSDELVRDLGFVKKETTERRSVVPFPALEGEEVYRGCLVPGIRP